MITHLGRACSSTSTTIPPRRARVVHPPATRAAAVVQPYTTVYITHPGRYISTLVGIMRVPNRPALETSRRELSGDVWYRSVLAPSRLSSNREWKSAPGVCGIHPPYTVLYTWYTPLRHAFKSQRSCYYYKEMLVKAVTGWGEQFRNNCRLMRNRTTYRATNKISLQRNYRPTAVLARTGPWFQNNANLYQGIRYANSKQWVTRKQHRLLRLLRITHSWGKQYAPRQKVWNDIGGSQEEMLVLSIEKVGGTRQK